MLTKRVGISATVVADSVYNGSRLTTFEATFPRFILAEFNTHRMFSRNSASSRAIPVWKRLAEVIEHPFVPLQFGRNKAGMQSEESLPEETNEAATTNWLVGRDVAVIQAFVLAGGKEQVMKDSKGNPNAVETCDTILELMDRYPDVTSRIRSLSVGVHKQHANRLLEPFSWHTVILTSSCWRNFYGLRASTMAQPEIQDLAIAMAQAHLLSVPQELDFGEWHLPYVFPEDIEEEADFYRLARISTARCARVSYLTHDGKRSLEADFSMTDKLQSSGHVSPFEHPATPNDIVGDFGGGNFGDKWVQYRKTLDFEHDFSRIATQEALLGGMKGDQGLVDFVLSLQE